MLAAQSIVEMPQLGGGDIFSGAELSLKDLSMEERREDYPGFRCASVLPVECSFTLPEPQSIQDLFHMTPYAWKTPKEGVARLERLERLTLTAQFRIHHFQRV